MKVSEVPGRMERGLDRLMALDLVERVRGCRIGPIGSTPVPAEDDYLLLTDEGRIQWLWLIPWGKPRSGHKSD